MSSPEDPLGALLKNHTYSVISCIQTGWNNSLCTLMGVILVLTVITQIVVVLSTIRIGRIMKRALSYHLAIHYCLLALGSMLVVYYLYYDELWLRSILELVKLTTFILVGYFFTLSALRLRLLLRLRRRVVNAGFIAFFVLLMTTTALMVKWGYDNWGCKNIARLILAGFQFIFALFFFIVSALILGTVSRDKTPRNKSTTTISPSFMIRHTRPLKVVLIVYSCSAITNLGFQIFLYSVTEGKHPCHVVLLYQALWVQWVYPIFRQIDLLVPCWAVLWYFFKTVNKKETYPMFVSENIQDERVAFAINGQNLPVQYSFGSGSENFMGFNTETNT